MAMTDLSFFQETLVTGVKNLSLSEVSDAQITLFWLDMEVLLSHPLLITHKYLRKRAEFMIRL